MMIIPLVLALGGSRSNDWRLKMLENASRSTVQSTKQVMYVLVDFILPDPIKDSPEICKEADVFSFSSHSIYILCMVQLMLVESEGSGLMHPLSFFVVTSLEKRGHQNFYLAKVLF